MDPWLLRSELQPLTPVMASHTHSSFVASIIVYLPRNRIIAMAGDARTQQTTAML